MKKTLTLLITLSLIVFNIVIFAGTTGKIAGQITDKETGKPLSGVNVIVQETLLGAATDGEGYFSIVNIPPGVYSVTATMIGYKKTTVSDVRVMIDLTTTLNIELEIETIQGEEVVVVAERKVIQEDISSSQLNVSSDQIEFLPVTSVNEVIGMHAGIEGLEVRRGSEDELAFLLDGVSMKDDRTGNPVSGIPLSSVKEIMIQSGGFSAEYSDLQSGVINVVTKEGSKDRYIFNFDIKVSPPAQKHFGISPYDPDSYFLRPYLDDEVCWTGTDNGSWDATMQERYPYFEGWVAVSERLLSNDDPSDDLTPLGAQRLFKWEHRRQGAITESDYNIDAGVGGPMPFKSVLSKIPVLGSLYKNSRFYSSYLQDKSMYLVPLSRDAIQNWSWSNKITTDLDNRIKIQWTSFIKKTAASSASETGLPSYYSTVYGLSLAFDGDSQQRSKLFYPEYYCLTDITSYVNSVKMTNQLNSTSYYDVEIGHRTTSYSTYPDDERDRTRKYDIFPEEDAEYLVDEAPWGYEWGLVSSIDGYMMGAKSNSRDSTTTSNFNGQFNYVNQFNQNNELKGGFSFDYYRFNMNYGAVNPALPAGRPWTKWSQSPYQIGAYIQDKLEFEGVVANIGLRMEYFSPNTEWYDVNPFDRSFYSSNFRPENEDDITRRKTKGLLTFLPRIGISHPISINSKLYFNYGHMRQKFTPDALFAVRRVTGYSVSYLGNPELPMEKTIMYELGYDHSLFNSLLVHIAAYYKDKSDQQSSISYETSDGTISYSMAANILYQDVRGLEIEVQKRRGDWISGFINYNYSVYTSGQFGVRKRFEDPAEQREYEKRTDVNALYKPMALPKLKFNLSAHVPMYFGNTKMSQLILGGWNVSLLGHWQEGGYYTYGNVSGVVNNVRYKDSYNVDMKLSKTFKFNKVYLSFIADIYNLFNIKRLSFASLGDAYLSSGVLEKYLRSLQFKEGVYKEISENHIAGDDKIGDYKPFDVDYQPMEWIQSFSDFTNPDERVYYYVGDLEDLANYFPDVDATDKISKYDRYVQYVDGEWVRVSRSEVKEVIENKAYIFNPVNESFMFLNPRDIFLGIKLSFEI